MTEELNGGCLDEREAFDRYWEERERELSFDGNPTDAERAFRAPLRESEFRAWKAGRASLSTSKQAGAVTGIVGKLRDMQVSMRMQSQWERAEVLGSAIEALAAPAAAIAAREQGALTNDNYAADWLTNRAHLHEWLADGAQMHPHTINLVVRFARALAEKLAAAEKKYGYSDGWLSPDWMDECRAKLMEHIAKGDPRDVAAYCAFLWHHGESTALAAPGAAIAAREQEAPSDDEQLVATLIHCSREVSPDAMAGYDLASVLSRAAERIQSLSTPPAATPAAPSKLTDSQIVHAANQAGLSEFIGFDRCELGHNLRRFARAIAALTQPTTVQLLKDHEIAKLVNDLRDVAKEFHGHQSLRERIAYLVMPLAKPTTVQQAEPSDVQMEQIADAIWGAQKKRLPMSAAIEFARAVLALKTAQTTALPGGNGGGE